MANNNETLLLHRHSSIMGTMRVFVGKMQSIHSLHKHFQGAELVREKDLHKGGGFAIYLENQPNHIDSLHKTTKARALDPCIFI